MTSRPADLSNKRARALQVEQALGFDALVEAMGGGGDVQRRLATVEKTLQKARASAPGAVAFSDEGFTPRATEQCPHPQSLTRDDALAIGRLRLQTFLGLWSVGEELVTLLQTGGESDVVPWDMLTLAEDMEVELWSERKCPQRPEAINTRLFRTEAVLHTLRRRGGFSLAWEGWERTMTPLAERSWLAAALLDNSLPGLYSAAKQVVLRHLPPWLLHATAIRHDVHKVMVDVWLNGLLRHLVAHAFAFLDAKHLLGDMDVYTLAQCQAVPLQHMSAQDLDVHRRARAMASDVSSEAPLQLF